MCSDILFDLSRVSDIDFHRVLMAKNSSNIYFYK